MNGIQPLSISILTPTYKRPDALKRCIESVQLLTVPNGAAIEHIVIDNEPCAPNRLIVATRARDAAIHLRYVHEPRAGVSHARNRGLAEAHGDWIVWIDDDQTVPPNWLTAMLRAQERLRAPVIFSAIRAQTPASVSSDLRAYLGKLYGRNAGGKDRLLRAPFGCGASMVWRAILPERDAFDPAANDTGGEDDILFNALIRRGVVMGYSAHAVAYEHVPESRASLGHALRRAFAFGQSPSQAAADEGWKAAHRVALWMAVGLGQALVYGPAAACARLAGLRRWPHYLDRAAQGLGKVLWMDAFAPKLYKPSAPAAPANGATGSAAGVPPAAGARHRPASSV